MEQREKLVDRQTLHRGTIASGVRPLSALWLATALFLCSPSRLSAQVPALSPKAPASAQTAATADPLGRETPRGTVIGFVRAAQEGNWQQARQYLQPVVHGRPLDANEEQELVDHLLAVLNARFPTLDVISRDADVRGDDGRLLNEITVAGARTTESFPLTLVRVDESHFGKIWLVSQKTLEEVPASYDSLRFPRLAQKLPSFLVKTRALGMPLWQWLAIVLLVPIALALGWLLASIARRAWHFALLQRGLPVPAESRHRRFGPGALLTAVFIHYVFVFQIGTSLLYRQYYRWLIWFLIAFGAYWALTHITAWIFRRLSQQLTDRGRLAERSLASLAQRVLNVLIFLVIGLIYLNFLDVNVTAALAGLGIGGLAIGLGAQKTFENLLGGISILTDKAIVVGDPCKIGDQTGVVEDIGLRSTKLRTEFRTMVSIPNGTVATATLENFRFRDKILSKQLLRLRYDLSPDHIRYTLGQIRGSFGAKRESGRGDLARALAEAGRQRSGSRNLRLHFGTGVWAVFAGARRDAAAVDGCAGADWRGGGAPDADDDRHSGYVGRSGESGRREAGGGEAAGSRYSGQPASGIDPGWQ